MPSQPAKTRQVNFRLPIDVWQRLDAAAGALSIPQSRIVSDALAVYFDAMPPEKRRVIDDVLTLRHGRSHKKKEKS